MIAIILILIVLFLIYDFYQRFYKPGIATKSWPHLAERAGLTFYPPTGTFSNRTSAQVMGNYRGYELKLDAPRVISGAVDDGLASYRTRIVLNMNSPVRGSFSFKYRWFFGRKFSRDEGVQIGDEVFDHRFVIKSRPKDYAARVFASADLRRRFLAIEELREFSLSNLGVRFEMNGIERDVKRLHNFLDLLADVVQAVKRLDKEW